MTAAPDPRPSKADLVHRQLREEIELGELAPGTPLSELSAGRAHRRVPDAGPRGAAPAGRRGAGRPGAPAGRPGVPGVAAERPRPVRLPRPARTGRHPAGDRGRGGRPAAAPRLHGDAHRVRPHPAPGAVAGALAGVLRAGRPVRLGGHRRDAQRAPAAHHRRAAAAHRAAAQPLARRPAAGRRLGGRAPGHLRRAAARRRRRGRREDRRAPGEERRDDLPQPRARRPAAASTCLGP